MVEADVLCDAEDGLKEQNGVGEELLNVRLLAIGVPVSLVTDPNLGISLTQEVVR